MTYTPSQTRALFARTCSFPTERETVVERVGDVTVAAPNGDGETIGEVLERSEQATYGSLAALHDTLMANLGEAHVGRKGYDDRSSNPERDDVLSF